MSRSSSENAAAIKIEYPSFMMSLVIIIVVVGMVVLCLFKSSPMGGVS